jgi:hypothetical protein
MIASPANAGRAALPQAVRSEIDEPIGAKSIEVAAMLGDSVVDVKHCIDPKSGTITRTTLAWLVIAAAMAVTVAVAFAVSVHVAAQNQHDLATWTHVLKRPAYAFRAHSLGSAYDAAVFGGLVLALVAAGVGLARLLAERRTPFYRIGTAPGVQLATSDAPAADFPLIAPSPDGDDFVMTYAAGIVGELAIDGASMPLAELAMSRGKPSARVAGAIELPIPAHAKIRARAGRTSFVISAVPAPRRHAAPLTVDNRVAAYFGGSLFAHMLVLGLLAQIPDEDSSASIDLDSYELAGIEASMTTNEVAPPPPTEGDTAGTGGSQGAAMALEEGAAGKPDATTHGRMTIENRHAAPQISRSEAIEIARHEGILGSLSADSFKGITGDITSGFDDATIYGAFDGAPGEARGTFGFGLSGNGPGAGGTGWGTIASGSYGTIGSGHGTGDGYGVDGGSGHGLRRHAVEVPRPIIGQPDGVQDGRDVIRRYIQRNLSKITYCYEKELLAKPTIAGEIVVQFFLSEAGKASAAVGQGFDPTVASCVADVIGNIEFPRMPSSATVRYPFTFRAPAR